MNSTNYIKSKIVSKNLARLKSITEENANLILNVLPEKMEVLVSHQDGIEVLIFDDESWWEAESLIVEEIKTRPDPGDRVELWECKAEDNTYDFEVHNSLLTIRKDLGQRVKLKADERALKQLCKLHGVPLSMGSLFLSELKLTTAKEDEQAVNRAKLLGLM